MNEKEILSWLVQLVIGGIISFGVYWIKQVKRNSEEANIMILEISKQLTKLNGQVQTCDKLRMAHETTDRDKHESCEQRILTIEKTLIHSQES